MNPLVSGSPELRLQEHTAILGCYMAGVRGAGI